MKFFKAAKKTALVHPQQKSRRLFFKMMGLGAGIGAAKVYANNFDTIGDDFVRASNYFAGGVELVVYRPQDLLELKLSYTGFKISPDFKSLTKNSSPNLLYVEFYPQNIAEQAFLENGNLDNSATKALNSVNGKATEAPFINASLSIPAKTYISGNSRLVFEIPSNINTIPLTPDGLLGWNNYKLITGKRAAAPCVLPAFDAKDISAPVFDGNSKDIKVNPAIINQNTNPPQRTERTPPVQNNNQTPQRTLPVRVIRNGVDTVKQVQLNRQIRGATKEEAAKIEMATLPPAVIKETNDAGIIAKVADLMFGKTPRPVPADETAIEMPYRLFISPNSYAAWKHAHELQEREDLKDNLVKTYPLWHSQLACKTNDCKVDCSDATKSIKTIRALWGVDVNGKWQEKPARDYSADGSKQNLNTAVNSYVTSLYNDDRHCIVHESSNWDLPNGFTPVPVQVNNLMLSSLGGWLDAEMLVKRSDLDKASLLGSLNLLKWKHIATLARDHYVEVVYAGNVLPFGHEASLVRITERKPKANYAANFQRYFVVINEEEKRYNPVNPVNSNFKSLPFSNVKFITTITPTIDNPQLFCNNVSDDDLVADRQFIPNVGGKPFYFKIAGYDAEGNEVDFTMPIVFVSTDVTLTPTGVYDFGNISKLSVEYNKRAAINQVPMKSQKMALAKSNTKGDTTFEIQNITFNCHFTADEKPGIMPRVEDLDIYMLAVQNLVGKKEAVKVKLKDYRNEGTVFAELVKPVNITFNTNGNGNKTGGSLAPDFGIKSISKTHGAIGSSGSDAANVKFDPSAFFAKTAKLFGVIDLSAIINKVDKAVAKINNTTGAIESALPVLKNIETNDALITQYVWNAATLKDASFGIVKFNAKNKAAGALKVETNIYRYKDPAKQSLLTVDSYIDDFAIEIASVAAVDFKRVGFKTGSNAKVDVTVDMANKPLRFLGALSFVNDLQKYIPTDGFSDPPYLDVSTDGVVTGYTQALPDLQLGAFTLRNVSLGAEINLPFNGDPLSLTFRFCEKQQPFTLTVSALGGGGFFAVSFDMNGLRSLEAALEFGAAASINLGVASGAVSIMGGVYFKMNSADKSYTLEGYVRINGAVSVLGLITASIEFLLTLAAEMKKVNGTIKNLFYQ
jgi:hypothetical protein